MACKKCGRWIAGIDCPSTLHPACDCSEGKARQRADEAIRGLWCAFRDLSDYDDASLTWADLELWALITKHRAVQDVLQA